MLRQNSSTLSPRGRLALLFLLLLSECSKSRLQSLALVEHFVLFRWTKEASQEAIGSAEERRRGINEPQPPDIGCPNVVVKNHYFVMYCLLRKFIISSLSGR